MMQMSNIADPNTYKLLTPGPLTTTLAVREAMLVDRCTWDDDYKAMTESIRASLLELAQANPAEYGVVLMQGSGTFGVESVLQPTAYWCLSTALIQSACARFSLITAFRLTALTAAGMRRLMLKG